MKKDGLAPPPPARDWTRIDGYIGQMRRRDAAARRRRQVAPRTEPETPRFVLSTLPFIALLIVLGVMTIAIVIAAWPGQEVKSKLPDPVHEVGTASKGWLQEAQRDMH